MIMSFRDFTHKYNLKHKATSNKKIQQTLYSLCLRDVGIYLRYEAFSGDLVTVILHATKGTHWVAYIRENYFDSYACGPPNKLSRFNMKRNGHFLNSENKIQGLDYYGAAYCLYMFYLTKDLGLDFISAVWNLCYQTISQKVKASKLFQGSSDPIKDVKENNNWYWC